jgi:hypothetical protein
MFPCESWQEFTLLYGTLKFIIVLAGVSSESDESSPHPQLIT